eukprot:TRINITY_DN32_c0_g1_i1.p1 TRINITY_DN32_c0_g1~~TRINITY_DN32_c0_g1_i1.p1  ORF type:complete len:394 (-),score=125.58 TRINITY_DN32_c0_g1_i1:219-1376(-)
MATRPLVSVYSGADSSVTEQVALPAIFSAPIRLDVVHHVHRDIAKNARQAYAVSEKAGHQTSAASWGTGRAVARIPRVSGGGTHRAGQGAFGNMCRSGRMFNPTKTWRRWHRRVNKNQRRFAIASALAASSSVPLVMARGHRVENVVEIPLVVSNETITELEKTSAAAKLLKQLSAHDDVDRVIASHKVRSGKGKLRNRRHVQRRGPLVIYDQKSAMVKAFRNIPGVELSSVNSLNLLQLAPGGHVGRFIIWTKAAIERLDSLYGTQRKGSDEKVGYHLPRSILTNSDIGRIINSDEVQSIVRPVRKNSRNKVNQKRNPLKNLGAMVKLNPYAKTQRRAALLSEKDDFRKKNIAAARAKRVSAASKKQKKSIAVRHADFIKASTA